MVVGWGKWTTIKMTIMNEIKPTEQQSPVLMFIIAYTARVALAFWSLVWPFKWKVLSWEYILGNVNYLIQLNEGLTSEYNERLLPWIYHHTTAEQKFNHLFFRWQT